MIYKKKKSFEFLWVKGKCTDDAHNNFKMNKNT